MTQQCILITKKQKKKGLISLVSKPFVYFKSYTHHIYTCTQLSAKATYFDCILLDPFVAAFSVLSTFRIFKHLTKRSRFEVIFNLVKMKKFHRQFYILSFTFHRIICFFGTHLALLFTSWAKWHEIFQWDCIQQHTIT